MRSDGPAEFYTLLNPLFFEDLGTYVPSAEYNSIARSLLGNDWRVVPAGFWTQCNPPRKSVQTQGWKIHLSTHEQNAITTLSRVVPLFADHNIPFKFSSDARMLRLSLSKNWGRTGSGKFITAYPRDVEECRKMLEACCAVTEDLAGPYILSDRPYKRSKVVFYRYGEHSGIRHVNPNGTHTPFILAPNGEEVAEMRRPYFAIPPWVSDPFSEAVAPELPPDGVLLHGRYRVVEALKYSSVGGVYGAVDAETNARVVIKEVRAGFDSVGGVSARQVLEKEARLLRRLQSTNLVPKFVDMFEVEGHAFLVQERIVADSLWGHAMNNVFAEEASVADVYQGMCDIVREIAEGMDTIHAAGVVLRDLTRNNVMFNADGKVKFIDFEFAYEIDGSDLPVAGWTVGFASREQLRREIPTPKEDHYALGALILDMAAYTAPGFQLNPAGVLRSLTMQLADLGLPAALEDTIRGLTADEQTSRWEPSRAVSHLRAHQTTKVDYMFPRGEGSRDRPAPTQELKNSIAPAIERIIDFVDWSADYSRADRLWPGSPAQFQTNPVNFHYGAAGVASFLFRAQGRIAPRAIDWILRHLSHRSTPPGLYAGMAGVAVVLSEFGMIERATELFEQSDRRAEIVACPDFYYGAAGWGMAALHLWQATKQSRFLERASDVGAWLAKTAKHDDRGAYLEYDGTIPLGFAHGQSGIATFLLTLWGGTGDAEFLSLARQLVDFEWSHRYETGYSLLWYPAADSPPGAPKSPHMRHGTAGVGTAVLRAYLATGDPSYLNCAEQCAHSVSGRFTNKPWHDYGLAGFGEYLLDMFAFTEDAKYLNAAYYVAEGAMATRADLEHGDAYFGMDLKRFSCDFGMGSAGIGAFLARLAKPSHPRLFMLDHLIVSRAKEANQEGACGIPRHAHRATLAGAET